MDVGGRATQDAKAEDAEAAMVRMTGMSRAHGLSRTSCPSRHLYVHVHRTRTTTGI